MEFFNTYFPNQLHCSSAILNKNSRGNLVLNVKGIICGVSPIFMSQENLVIILEAEDAVIKGGKFLKKLWCCVGGRVYKGNLAL